MSIFSRRILFFLLVGVSMAGLLALMGYALSKDGFSWAESILFLCFTVTLPWTVIGFWNAVIGFMLMRFADDPASHVFPALAKTDDRSQITSNTAVALCIRNEDVGMVRRNLETMIAEIAATGNADHFHMFVLSDSDDPLTIQEEEVEFDALSSKWLGLMKVTYRRRDDNPGFKAGNIQDFCARWGDDFDHMLTLDADSVMSAQTILKLVRLMEQNGQLGIVQSLVVGLPSVSPFTRVFQFGMRLGMRSYTLGSAWWQADCGPYWGHNALLRLKPFRDHCELPKIGGDGPLSGWILSHDQVEAVLMRKAGLECRVLVEETGSYEENPPHILEFIRRDLRWCHGNMQYFKLLSMPGLKLMSRMQLVLAILMFVGSPAWLLFVSIATGSIVFPAQVPVEMHIEQAGYPLFLCMMIMVFAPKLASIADMLMDGRRRGRFGGAASAMSGALTELLFSMLLAPIMAVANSIFLFQLFILKKPKSWLAQSRSASSLPLRVVTGRLWPQTLFGAVGATAVISSGYTSAVVYVLSLPVFLGPLFAIGIGKITSNERLGTLLAKLGIWQIPEERYVPDVIGSLRLPAVEVRRDADVAETRADGKLEPLGGQIDPAE